MKKFKLVEYYCPECKKEVNEDDFDCPHCGTKIKDEEEEENKSFKTQYFYGNLIAMLGWLIVIFGFVALFYILAASDHLVTLSLYLAIFICVSSFLIGLLLVAVGQFFQSHVQIEKNTSETNRWLKKIYEKEMRIHLK